MKNHQKTIVLSIFILAIIGVAFFPINRDISSLLAENINDDYSLTISSFSQESKQTFLTKNGNPLTFCFDSCYLESEGRLRVNDSSSISNETNIYNIKSILVTSIDLSDEIHLEYDIFLNDQIVTSDVNHMVNEVFNINANNDAFAVSFEDEVIISSIIITYSCI